MNHTAGRPVAESNGWRRGQELSREELSREERNVAGCGSRKRDAQGRDGADVIMAHILAPKHFCVGVAADPQPEDRIYPSEAAAIEAAAHLAECQGFTRAVAVWDEMDQPLRLFMLGQQFRRV